MRRDRYRVPGIQHVLRFWNNEVFENTEGVLQTIYDALTPTLSQREREFQTDASIARHAPQETLRQAGAIVRSIGLIKKLYKPC